MTSPLSPEAVAQTVADRKNAMTIQDALETLSAMASVQDGYAKKATDRVLRIIHKANAKAQREVSATVTTLAAENATLRAERDECDAKCERLREGEANLSRLLNENDRAEVAETELATLRASEAAALERIGAIHAIANELSWAAKTRSIADRLRAALTPTADKEPKT